MQSLIKCIECGHHSVNYESFLDLSLELSSGASVEEALQSYTDIEKLDSSVGWRCEKYLYIYQYIYHYFVLN